MCGSLLPEYRDAEAGGFLQEPDQLVQVNLCTLGSRRNPASKQNQTRYRVTEQNTCCQPLASKHTCTSTHINVYAQEHIHKLMPMPTHTRKTPKQTLQELNEIQPYQHSYGSGWVSRWEMWLYVSCDPEFCLSPDLQREGVMLLPSLLFL